MGVLESDQGSLERDAEAWGRPVRPDIAPMALATTAEGAEGAECSNADGPAYK